jgi:SPP1 gp7 family putative phage head morphogenesis protein
MPPMARSERDSPNGHRAAAIATLVDLGNWDELIEPIADDLADVYASGIVEGAPLVSLQVDTDQVNERALEWAQERAADLITQIEENTRDMLRDAIHEAIDEGIGADELADMIADSTGFSDYRAEMIARTETNRANNQGNLRAYKDAGVERKEWMTAGDDLVEEDCEDNEAVGAIGLDEDFPSGDDAPPAHPNCRCSISPVFEPDDTAQEDEDEEE